MQNNYAKSYLLEVSSDESESGKLYCHPLLVSDNTCKAESVLADRIKGEVHYVVDSDNVAKIPYPTKNLGRQDIAFFTRNRTYSWRLRTCFDETAARCSDFGQAWKFSTKTDPIGIPETAEPKNDPNGEKPVGLPIGLSWTIPDGANSFIYETSFTSGEQKTITAAAPSKATSTSIKKLFDATNVKADTEYKWRVKACSKFDSTNCDGWSEWFVFRTTGRPVKPDLMAVTAGIPAIFSWEAVPGAKSYNLSVAKKDGIAKIILANNESIASAPKITVGYPDIDQGQDYTWKVQTCAHTNGTVCGEWSEEKTFATAPLLAVGNPQPSDGATIYADQMANQVSWDSVIGASAYSYIINLTEPAESDTCPIKDAIIDKVTNSTKNIVNLKCLGKYRFSVEPCVDAKCTSRGPVSVWTFTLAQREPENKFSLSICGTGYNNPATPWNEREACQPKHLLILIKVIIDFLLFRLSILLLPILVLITGLIYYTQFKTPEVWDKIKSMWKAIGIGYALLIFSWLIVGFLLQIVGFPGLWYKIL